jgi:hypothetical protein
MLRCVAYAQGLLKQYRVEILAAHCDVMSECRMGNRCSDIYTNRLQGKYYSDHQRHDGMLWTRTPISATSGANFDLVQTGRWLIITVTDTITDIIICALPIALT